MLKAVVSCASCGQLWKAFEYLCCWRVNGQVCARWFGVSDHHPGACAVESSVHGSRELQSFWGGKGETHSSTACAWMIDMHPRASVHRRETLS